MDSRQRLVTRLKAIAAVTDLVAGRIWPLVAPQGETLPYIVYRRVDATPISHAGGSARDDFDRLQVECCAAGYDGAIELAAAVRGDEADDDPSGLGGWTDGDGRLWLLDSEQDDMEDFLAGRDSPAAFRIVQDFLV